MPLEEINGKFSYPIHIKKEMFSFLFNKFNKQYKKDIFFYLCMEDISLWNSVLGRSYDNNDQFENDMKFKYMERINERFNE